MDLDSRSSSRRQLRIGLFGPAKKYKQFFTKFQTFCSTSSGGDVESVMSTSKQICSSYGFFGGVTCVDMEYGHPGFDTRCEGGVNQALLNQWQSQGLDVVFHKVSDDLARRMMQNESAEQQEAAAAGGGCKKTNRDAFRSQCRLATLDALFSGPDSPLNFQSFAGLDAICRRSDTLSALRRGIDVKASNFNQEWKVPRTESFCADFTSQTITNTRIPERSEPLGGNVTTILKPDIACGVGATHDMQLVPPSVTFPPPGLELLPFLQHQKKIEFLNNLEEEGEASSTSAADVAVPATFKQWVRQEYLSQPLDAIVGKIYVVRCSYEDRGEGNQATSDFKLHIALDGAEVATLENQYKALQELRPARREGGSRSPKGGGSDLILPPSAGAASVSSPILLQREESNLLCSTPPLMPLSMPTGVEEEKDISNPSSANVAMSVGTGRNKAALALGPQPSTTGDKFTKTWNEEEESDDQVFAVSNNSFGQDGDGKRQGGSGTPPVVGIERSFSLEFNSQDKTVFPRGGAPKEKAALWALDHEFFAEVQKMSSLIAETFGVDLFGFDVLRIPTTSSSSSASGASAPPATVNHIVDVNFFPGYSNTEAFFDIHQVVLCHLCSLVKKKEKR